ncbi:hypothetical protein [Stenotrophomonas nematodicola]|uniref:hypothetical protein n=1 Tax=Stenotrophomonas nematodicola TaxID=2656746 RepID=UPI00129117B7|nr:hypothetical protein [Stenotrophomonas nematodicola]
MSAPSKIPAIRHAVSALHGAADDGADTRRYAEQLQEAAAGLDELVEASHLLAYSLTDGTDSRQHHLAVYAALARVKGGAA